jgi:hypothetical protein
MKNGGKVKPDKLSYSAPRQDLSPAKIREIYGSQEEYDAQMVRYCATFYNRPASYNDGYLSSVNPSQNGSLSTSSDSPVMQIIRNYRYYNGDQVNYNYAFLSETITGEEVPAPFIPGQKAFQIIEFLKASYAAAIRNAKIRARSTSNEAMSKREERFVLAMIKMKYRELFDKLEDEADISVNPVPDEFMSSKEDVEKYISETPFETSEKLCQELLDTILRVNSFTKVAIRSYFDMRVGRYTGIVTRVVNGMVETKDIRPDQLIVDNRIDDDLNAGAQFAGMIEYLTPEEIFARWDFDENERSEIISLAGGTNDQLSLLNGGEGDVNFKFWDVKDRLVAVITMYWMQLTDTRYVYKLDANGNRKKPHEYRILGDDDERAGDFFVEVPRQCVLIGNKFVRDNKFCDNIVYHPTDKKRPLLPLQICTPNMVSGICKSAMDRIISHQDMHDAISWRIRDKVAKAHGKVPIIDGSQLENMGASDLEEDFKKMGFSVVNLASPDPNDPTERRPLVQYADFTMDSDVRMLIEIKREEERLIDDLYNTSPIVMGKQTTYTGYGTQQASIGQATLGIANDTETHIQFIDNVLQLAVNTAKNFYSSEEGKKVARDILSKRALNLLAVSKDLRWEDISISVDVMDNISDTERKELLILAQTIIPTGNLEALEALVDVQSQPTKTSLKASLGRIVAKVKAEKEKAEMMANMQAAARQDAQAQTDKDLQMMKSSTEAYKADTDADTKLEINREKIASS